MPDTIPPRTSIGAVHLVVRDLEGALAFYTERLGFKLHAREKGVARLGVGAADLLFLRESPNAPRVPGTTGLYHFAILVPSRLALARSLQHLLETGTPLTGAADHLVSEALYLDDPEGNGVEIYCDRPREQWNHERGEVRMASLRLDLEGVLSELADHSEPWRGLAPGTVIGHVHLRVAHIDDSERFYVGVLGFERMLRFGPSALFVAAGGYHHHIGLNTWESAGAPPPPPDAAGLRHFVVRVPDSEGLQRVADRLHAADIAIEEGKDGLLVRDPSQNRIVLSVGDESPAPS